MPTTDTTQPRPLTTAQLNSYDVLLIDHAMLDQFIDDLGGVKYIPETLDIFTEDKYTQQTVKFNLIIIDEDSPTNYRIATQLHNPTQSTDRVLDLRESQSDFTDTLQGLTNQ